MTDQVSEHALYNMHTGNFIPNEGIEVEADGIEREIHLGDPGDPEAPLAELNLRSPNPIGRRQAHMFSRSEQKKCDMWIVQAPPKKKPKQ